MRPSAQGEPFDDYRVRFKWCRERDLNSHTVASTGF